jgi:alkylation response protein AidB-like acyl-CoA dehydrogenase
MDFDLSPELAELQASVRKLARERVAPRAREIDSTQEYPQDLFDLFVASGLTGLCIPESLGGSGAGIFGLVLAIEEVAKYSNAAALMLLLTRLPAGPLLIAGSPELQEQYVRPIATGSSAPRSGSPNPRPAPTSWGCAPGPRWTAPTGCSTARSAGCRG